MADLQQGPKILNDTYDEEKVKKSIADAIEKFYEDLVKSINELNLDKILSRKNPYLFFVKNYTSPEQFISSILDAYISSSEETIFGNDFFEPIAIAVSGGMKSASEGVDLEIDATPIRYAIAVKSGTSVFNADSKKRQKQNFDRAATLMRQHGQVLYPIIGYGYGTKRLDSRSSICEYAGQDFWEALTGDSDFYTKIIAYAGDTTEVLADKFERSRAKALGRLTEEFSRRFVADDGTIDWVKILQFNSGSIARAQQAEFDKIKVRCLGLMRRDRSISKKKLREQLGCTDKILNSVVESLQAEREIACGCNCAPWRVI